MVEGQNHFGKLLKKAREAAGLSRVELAQRIGLNPSHIYRLETGDRNPSEESVLVLAEALLKDSEPVSEWLTAAGYASIPDLGMTRGPIRTRGARTAVPKGQSLPVDAALRAKLKAMGFQEARIDRLLKAMESASVPERQQVAKALSNTFTRAAAMLEAPVRTAVIPAAGGHHRIVATHVMQGLLLRTIAEAVESGVSQIILVLAPGSVDSLYTPLKEALDLAVVPPIKLLYVVQAKPEGLGDAILHAKDSIGNEPFAVLLPDDVVRERIGRTAHPRELRRMMDAFKELSGANLLAVASVTRSKMGKCGVAQVGTKEVASTIRPITKLVERPSHDDHILGVPRVYGIVGRYLLRPNIFDPLKELRKKKPPIHLTDGLGRLLETGEHIYAFELKAEREDLGEVIGEAGELLADSSGS